MSHGIEECIWFFLNWHNYDDTIVGEALSTGGDHGTLNLQRSWENMVKNLCAYFDLLSLAIITCPLPKLKRNNRQLKVWLSWCCLNNQLSEISMWMQLHMIWLIMELSMIQSSPFVAPEVMVVILSGNFIVWCSKFYPWWSHNPLFEQDIWSLNPL
jgi:hypothetical protein